MKFPEYPEKFPHLDTQELPLGLRRLLLSSSCSKLLLFPQAQPLVGMCWKPSAGSGTWPWVGAWGMEAVFAGPSVSDSKSAGKRGWEPGAKPRPMLRASVPLQLQG